MNDRYQNAEKLIVQEVAPRDGLQIEPTWVETAYKIALSRGLPVLPGHDVPGQLAKAGRNRDLHAVPDYVLQI